MQNTGSKACWYCNWVFTLSTSSGWSIVSEKRVLWRAHVLWYISHDTWSTTTSSIVLVWGGIWGCICIGCPFAWLRWWKWVWAKSKETTLLSHFCSTRPLEASSKGWSPSTKWWTTKGLICEYWAILCVIKSHANVRCSQSTTCIKVYYIKTRTSGIGFWGAGWRWNVTIIIRSVVGNGCWWIHACSIHEYTISRCRFWSWYSHGALGLIQKVSTVIAKIVKLIWVYHHTLCHHDE